MTDLNPHLGAIISRELRVHSSAVVPRASLSRDLHADSLDVLCVVVAIEDEFGVRITDTQAASLYDGTVADVAVVLEVAEARGGLHHG